MRSAPKALLVITAVFFAFYPFVEAFGAEEKYEAIHSTNPVSGGNEEKFKVVPSTIPALSDIECEFGISSSTILSGVPIKLNSDYARYIREEDRLYARGNVVVEYEGTIIKCDEIDIKIQAKEINARGNCSIKDSYEIYGDSITYNFDTKDGTVINANCRVEEWYFRGPRMEKKGDGKFILYRGYASSCDKLPAHYRLAASRITIIPDRWLIFNWVSLMIGNIPLLPPILPFPKIVIPLKMERLGWKGRNYEVGYNSQDGPFAMAFLPFTIFTKNDGMLDIKLSTAKQLEYGVSLDEKYKTKYIDGNFHISNDGYRTIGGELENNLNVYAKHNQDFPGLPGLKLQSNVNYMNKNDVNQKQSHQKGEDLAREEMELVTRNISSDIAFSYTKSNYSMKVFAERKDLWNDTTNQFEQSGGHLPSASFNLNQIKLFSVSKFPVYFSAGAGIDNKYNTTNSNNYKLSARDNAKLETSFNINTINTFGMNMKYGQNWDEETNELSDSFTSGFTWTSDLNMVCLLPVKMNYTFAWDMKKNESSSNNFSFRVDSLRGKKRKKKQLGAVVTTGLTLPAIKDEVRIPTLTGMCTYFMENLDKIHLKINYDTDNSLFYMDYYYDIKDTAQVLWKPLSLDMNFIYTPFGSNLSKREDKKGWYWTNNIKYFGSTPNKIDITNNFGFWFTRKMRFDFRTRADVFTDDFGASNFVRSEINIYRDLHCWEVNLKWVMKPTTQELWLRFNIKVIPESKIGVSGRRTRPTVDDSWNTQWELLTE